MNRSLEATPNFLRPERYAMSPRSFFLTASIIVASLLSAPSSAIAQDPNLNVVDNFNGNREGWEIYDYDGGGSGNVFYPATWENSGGIGNSGYVWGDDSRWRIDTPEAPDSILSFIIYRNWIGEGPLDLRDARVSVYLRGDQLDLKGADVYFWVLESDDIGHRWHFTSNPFEVTQDAWGEKLSFVLKNDENLWHRSWTRSPLVPATLDDILGHVDSYGLSFVGFSEEVTGTFAMDELELSVDTVQPGIFRWQTNGLGDWNSGSNWDAASVPNSNTDTIILGNDVSSTTTVVTNSPVTAKTIQFDNASDYIVAGAGSVNLQADMGNASVDIVQGDHQFQAVVNLESDTDLNIAAGSSLVFNNVLNLGANDLNITGAGTLQINTALITSGGGSVVVAAGTLGGSGEIGTDVTNTIGIIAPGNSSGRRVVAEPSSVTILLIASGLAALAGCRRWCR